MAGIVPCHLLLKKVDFKQIKRYNNCIGDTIHQHSKKNLTVRTKGSEENYAIV